VMGVLIGASRLVAFDGSVLLKGFNAAISLTSLAYEPFAIWHLILNQDGSRIPYTDSRLRELSPQFNASDVSKIETSRHVLGWIPKASYNFGMSLSSAAC
jgi:hypothetical protein